MTALSSSNLPPVACVILAAGLGTRMKSEKPKVMHEIARKPLVAHVVAACESLGAEKLVVVVGPSMESVKTAVTPHACVIQAVARGTGDAVKPAQEILSGFQGDILVLFGDTPLVTSEALQSLRIKRAQTGAAIVVAGFTPQDPAQYGRLILDQKGHLQAIVEYKDASEEQRAIGLCNGGIMLFAAAHLWDLLAKIQPNNAKNEYYLTDSIALARAAGLDCAVAIMEETSVFGINTRQQLAEAEAMMQDRLRRRAMDNGATMIDPASVFLAADTVLGRDVVLGPNVFFGSGVSVGDQVEIRAFSHLEGVRVANGVTIGPFARLRPGADLGENVHIGNFVEIKNARLGAGTKVNHLSYIGDAEIGTKTNIGAGTITCNYDGYKKHKTIIGDGVFIGSNTSLVAPVKIGSGAITGAGSTVTHDIPQDALAVSRAKQTHLEEWAARFRKKNEKPV